MLSNYSILIVDDVPLNQLLVKKMLGDFDFNVRTADNGLEAIREIMAEKPALVLLDILMPVMDGFEVLQKLKEKPEWNDIKVIVLSALNSNEDIVKAFNLGSSDFITKPILMDKLCNSVAKVLEIPLKDVSAREIRMA